ncbi:CYTH and CHAD domain-containing protein [Cryptosporangium aurantiacum]|uniref:Inorganic triphosphatase YgiF, contains CYTH and CHAD domains n=1 Tax=Cryptosporangium aurantiacum TaxID=134849 RepID=A0A1M7HQH0_9ACTN|nr:CYTH and CHAD domain-containing protein [Cryptosporangium aurantiacum]SHM30638.1 Inorganic triphosphatase YgiF, contains CYTH and CHAD domains [Cryptosporangium aurantiacum]
MREEELKFGVHGRFALPDLTVALGDGRRVEAQGRQVLTAVYYDTADLRLARLGITLRHRTGEDGPPWHLKLPKGATAAGATVREEIAVDGPADTPPSELTDLVTAWVRTAPLVAVATLRTDRDRYLIVDGKRPLAELVDDTVEVSEGRGLLADGSGVRTSFRELEVERKSDGKKADAALAAAAAVLTQAGAVGGATTPKLVRALGPRATAPPDLPVVGELTDRSSAADAIAFVLRRSARRLLDYDVRVRRDEKDAVHQARVCCRRLRSDLRTFGPLIDAEWAAPLDAELRWLAAALGGPRDAEVLRARLRSTAETDPLAPLDAAVIGRIDAILGDRQRRALTNLDAALTSDRYPALLDLLIETVRTPETAELARQRAVWVLPAMVEVVWDKLATKAGKLTLDDPDDTWHASRIRAKRARYASEAVAPVIGASATRLAKACAEVQEVLGEHQDAAIAADEWRDIALAHADDTELVITCGRLIERERAAVRESRARFAPVWERTDRPKLTGWLRG